VTDAPSSQQGNQGMAKSTSKKHLRLIERSSRNSTSNLDPIGVQVFGEHELLDRILKGERHYSHCVSIRNPEQEMHDIMPPAFQEILELKFHDVEREDQLPNLLTKKAPRLEDAQRIVDFVNATRSVATGYTIHCWHGHSRSTAVALGVLYMLLGSEEEAAGYLVRVRPNPRPSPNLALLSYFDQLLDSKLRPHGKQLQDHYIEGLRHEVLETLWPEDEIEELAVLEDDGLLRRALRLTGL
jgi:predicted protein tyrosine phosphatase